MRAEQSAAVCLTLDTTGRRTAIDVFDCIEHQLPTNPPLFIGGHRVNVNSLIDSLSCGLWELDVAGRSVVLTWLGGDDLRNTSLDDFELVVDGLNAVAARCHETTPNDPIGFDLTIAYLSN